MVPRGPERLDVLVVLGVPRVRGHVPEHHARVRPVRLVGNPTHTTLVGQISIDTRMDLLLPPCSACVAAPASFRPPWWWLTLLYA